MRKPPTFTVLFNCAGCAKQTLRKSSAQRRCPECAQAFKTKISYTRKVNRGAIKNPGIGSGGLKGSLHPNWKAGVASYRKHLKSACESCGTPTKPLEVHHIDRNQLNNFVTNLKTLCKSCHRKAHGKEISARMMGNKHSLGHATWLGKKHSSATKAKISAARSGSEASPEARANMSAAGRGKKKSPEHSAKIRAAHLGKPKSESHVAAMKAAWIQRKAQQLGTST